MKIRIKTWEDLSVLAKSTDKKEILKYIDFHFCFRNEMQQYIGQEIEVIKNTHSTKIDFPYQLDGIPMLEWVFHKDCIENYEEIELKDFLSSPRINSIRDLLNNLEL